MGHGALHGAGVSRATPYFNAYAGGPLLPGAVLGIEIQLVDEVQSE